MCGIVGFSGKIESHEQLLVLQQVLVESRIRGMHASGIVWSDGKALHSTVKPIPIDKLVSEFDWTPLFNKKISLIAHARYSTSDIRYNQPIVGEKMAIAHNGVITQSNPKNWEKQYGYKCKTQNDSELLLRALESGDNIWDVFPDSSIAFVAISKSGQMIYGRNGARPLWLGMIGDNIVYASTCHILDKTGVTGITKVSPSDYKELQRRNCTQWEKK